MFDHGFSNYIQHAAPKDNLLPISCTGEDWQGGLALTLIDALDTLLVRSSCFGCTVTKRHRQALGMVGKCG